MERLENLQKLQKETDDMDNIKIPNPILNVFHFTSLIILIFYYVWRIKSQSCMGITAEGAVACGHAKIIMKKKIIYILSLIFTLNSLHICSNLSHLRLVDV